MQVLTVPKNCWKAEIASKDVVRLKTRVFSVVGVEY